MSRSAAAILVSLFALPALAQDERPFTTGPVAGTPDGAPPPPALDDVPSPLEGDDVRANPVTTSAQNETSLAVNPTDPSNWVGVANDYRFGSPQTGWYTTRDGGKTWTSGTFGVDAGFSFSGDPCVTFDSQGVANVVCMMYDGPGGVDRVKAFRSTDGGTLWSAGVVVGAVAGYDKPQLEADLGPSSPNEDHLLVAWNHFGAPSGDLLVVSTSSTQGFSWTAPQVISDAGLFAIGPDVAWGAGGEAYVAWADRGVNDVLFDRSLDGGATWSADTKVADFEHVPDTLPGNFLRVFDVFAMHADQSSGPFGGRIYVAYHTWAGGFGSHRADVLVASSSDQGSTWSAPVKVTNDSGQNDQLFPGVVVDAQGNVNVAYYDQRNDPNDVLLWTWVSRSADGGATWLDAQVSDVGWNDLTSEFRSFIGDYIDNEAAPDGLLHPFWCDARTGSQDVYTDSVNLQLVTNVDVLSAATGGTVDFQIRIGPNHAGEAYLLVAGGSGTAPGVTLAGGQHVSLNPDFWTELSIAFAGTALFPGSVGMLSASGAAFARLDTLGPFPPAFAGTSLDFSVLAIGPGGIASHATPPTRVTLAP